MSKQASAFLSEQIKRVVITVPGGFGKSRREATAAAAVKVGLQVVRVLNEPVAAALAFGYHKDSEQTIAVFDLGGGTVDVSLLKIGGGSYKLLAAESDPWLGGEDFDHLIVKRAAAEFERKHRINIFNDKMAHQRLKLMAEDAKIRLSSEDSVRIYIPSICPDLSKVADVDYTLSRAEFEELFRPLIERAASVLLKALQAADLKAGDIDNLIMVGGMTRVPLIREHIAGIMGRAPEMSVNPDEAVAMGAGICAATLAGEKVDMQPPISTRPNDEYLSGDVDIHSLYAEVLQNRDLEEEREQAFANARPQAQPGYPGSPAPGGAWQQQQQYLMPQLSVPAAPPDHRFIPIPEPEVLAGYNFDAELPPPLEPGEADIGESDVEDIEEIQELEPIEEDHERPTGLQLEIASKGLGPQDTDKVFVDKGDGDGKWVTGRFAIASATDESVRIRVYRDGNGSGKNEILGEFLIHDTQAANGTPPNIRVSFAVKKETPFQVAADGSQKKQ